MYFKIIVFVSVMLFANASSPNSKHQKRISNGLQAGVGQFPYQVLIQYQGLLLYFDICGGGLVKVNYVLTAAECIVNSKMRVRAGFVDKFASRPKYREVIAKTVHPSYNQSTLENNIAVLKLEKGFTLDNTIALLNLPIHGSQPTGTGILAGWGATEAIFGIQSTLLNYASFNVITEAACKTAVGSDLESNVQNTTVCAQSTTSNACSGDEGGPLVAGSNTVIGIASWTPDNCGSNGTIVFAKVSSYIDFINTNTP